MAGRRPALAAEALRRWAFASPLYRYTLVGRQPEKLAATPTDPWSGDAARGVRLIDGVWSFAGQTFAGQEGVPWFPQDARPDWIAAMHGFAWLRDLREAGQAARATARGAVHGWIEQCGRWHPLTWRADVIGARIAAWLANANFLLVNADPPFRRRVLASLAEQARHLARVAQRGPDGAARLRAVKGMVYAALCLPGNERRLGAALAMLDAELRRQVLPDGGHVERNPSTLLAVFRDAVELRGLLHGAGREVPQGLLGAIDRMAPMLRFFRHGDGALALFHGGAEEAAPAIDGALALAQAGGKPAAHAEASGFVRLAARRTTILVDAGRPPAPPFAARAHAGTAAFEMSVGADRMVVNCGAYQGADANWELALRATAAHSTVTVDDTNSAELLPRGGLGRGPGHVRVERAEQDGEQGLVVEHDGYQSRLQLAHRRTLWLSADGQRLRGEDRLIGPGGERFAVRFHLHPGVPAASVEDGSVALLRLPSGTGWRLSATGGVVAVTDSVYLGRPGEMRRGQQVVVSGGLNGEETVIAWELAAIPAKAERRRS